jgi:hypothetical protein
MEKYSVLRVFVDTKLAQEGGVYDLAVVVVKLHYQRFVGPY